METVTLYQPAVHAPDGVTWGESTPVADGTVHLISEGLNNALSERGPRVWGTQFEMSNGFAVPILRRRYTFDYDALVSSAAADDDDERLDRLPLSVRRSATLLDRRSLAHVQPYWQQTIARSTYQLNTSAISTLIRVVDAADNDAQTAVSVLDGQHRILESYGWYKSWSPVALPAALLGGLTRTGLVDLLREARRRHRRERVRRPRPSSSVRRLLGQLERLANFIAPNAPPHGADIHIVAGVATL